MIRPILDEVLVDLPETTRDALVVRYLSDCDDDGEVAGRLGCSTRTARHRVAEGMNDLRIKMGQKGVCTSEDLLKGVLEEGGQEKAPKSLFVRIRAAIAGQNQVTKDVEALAQSTLDDLSRHEVDG